MCLNKELSLSEKIEWIKMKIDKKSFACPQCGITLYITSMEQLPKYAYCPQCNDYFYSQMNIEDKVNNDKLFSYGFVK